MQTRVSQSAGPVAVWSDADEDAITHVLVWDTYPHFTDRERLLIEYAERFTLRHETLDAAFYGRLHEVFDDAAILEATVLIARHLGFGRLSHVLALDT
jgi:alkylhydroperoxidase family enzyme